MNKTMTEHVLEEFMDLGRAVLQYEKEYGRYDFVTDRVNKSMLVDPEKNAFGMVGVYAVRYIDCSPAAFLADIQREWRALEDAIERNIVNDVEPKVDDETLEALEALEEDAMFV